MRFARPGDQARHVRHRKADSFQVGLDRHPRNRPWVPRGRQGGAVLCHGVCVAWARPVEADAYHALERTRQPDGPAASGCRDDHRTARGCVTHGVQKRAPMLLAARPEAQVDDVQPGVSRPADGMDDSLDRRGEASIEHSNGIERRVRCLLANRRGDGGAVPHAIACFRRCGSVVENGDSARHLADMRVSRVDAAVDHANSYAVSCVPLPEHAVTWHMRWTGPERPAGRPAPLRLLPPMARGPGCGRRRWRPPSGG